MQTPPLTPDQKKLVETINGPDNTLSFSYNWNKKLNCNLFTTIRISEKYTPGSVWQVECKGVETFFARVRDRKTFTKETLTEWVSLIDTGYSKDETLAILHRMYPASSLKTTFYLMLMERLKPDQVQEPERMTQESNE